MQINNDEILTISIPVGHGRTYCTYDEDRQAALLCLLASDNYFEPGVFMEESEREKLSDLTPVIAIEIPTSKSAEAYILALEKIHKMLVEKEEEATHD